MWQQYLSYIFMSAWLILFVYVALTLSREEDEQTSRKRRSKKPQRDGLIGNGSPR